MRARISLRDFGAGIIVGLLVGSTGLAAASFGYEGWKRFSQDFKIGYVTGFLEMADLARNLDPGGYVDSRYPMVTKAKDSEWAHVVDELYRDPENQKYRMYSILQLAASQLEKKYGKAMSPEERTRLRMETQLGLAKKRREAMGIQPKPGEPPLPEPKVLQAPEKKVETPAVKKKEPKQRKWCRCDGKDPKAERAKRRAEAAKQAEEKTAPAKAAPGDGKTPPAKDDKAAPAKPEGGAKAPPPAK